MRILLVNDYATESGGAELQMHMLRSALRARDHDVCLFASTAGDPPADAADEYCLGTTSALRTPLQAANPFAKARFRRVVNEFEPDVVHVRLFLTQLSPLILSPLRDVPSILHVSWYRVICPRGTKLLPDGRDCEHHVGLACLRERCLSAQAWTPMMLQFALLRRRLPAFNRVVTLSESSRQRLAAAGFETSVVLRNAVQERPMRPPLDGPPTVAFAGRLVWEKGVDLLVRAVRETRSAVPAARLLIVGDGPERPRLEALVRGLGLGEAVEFAGALDRGSLEGRMGAAWVQAMPGRWIEPFGNAAAEALMRGTALVATEPGGAAELVRESGAGAVVRRGDVAALAEALAARLADRDLCETEGTSGRAWAVDNLRYDDYVSRLETMYREVAAEAA
jgi:glycosyltransferase involved in cell wall biosynthesis